MIEEEVMIKVMAWQLGNLICGLPLATLFYDV
jgi:hypothetical protein